MILIVSAASTFKGGAEQVLLSFIHECREFSENTYHVVIAPNLSSQIDQREFAGNFHFHEVSKRPASNILHFIKMMRWFKNLERKIHPDCVICTGGHEYWRPKAPILGGFNMAHFIYPESPFFRNIKAKERFFWKVKKRIHLYFYNRLDAILVQTEAVKVRLRNILTSRAPIYIVSNTVNAHFIHPKVYQNKLSARKNKEIRLLTVSSYYKHKNLGIIPMTIKYLEEKGILNFRFIVTLPDEKYTELFGNGLSGKIVNVGPIPISECPSLYDECDFMFLPTLLECFSASYVEAMVMKKPILTSDMDFAHTICQDAAVYFNPFDPMDIADKIISLSKDQERQSIMISNGVRIMQSINSSKERAKKYLEICKEISEK